ncbi:MAG: MBL fold metallo-hydrolase [Dehalococcoidales bacterium]|nr:MBL fold metallo-hydrolase [Dehalococcoidales bacterium]
MKIHRVTLPTPFAIGPVNTYLIEDEELALVDTGPKMVETSDALQNGLRDLGYTFADLKHIIITHAHEDHFGQARFLKEQSGARVYAHKASLPMLEGLESEFDLRYNVYRRRLMRNAGAPEEVILAVQPIVDSFKESAEAVAVDEALEDGDVIHVGRTQLQVIYTPGHAAGAMCLHHPGDKILFSGDHLLPDVSSNAVIDAPLDCGDCRRRSLVEYISSLRLIQAMGLDLVYPAHGDEIRDHRTLIEQRLAFYETRKSAILGALGDGEKTPYQLSRKLFPAIREFEIFLALSEVIGHLDLLENEGKVAWRMSDGVVRYRRGTASG